MRTPPIFVRCIRHDDISRYSTPKDTTLATFFLYWSVLLSLPFFVVCCPPTAPVVYVFFLIWLLAVLVTHTRSLLPVFFSKYPSPLRVSSRARSFIDNHTHTHTHTHKQHQCLGRCCSFCLPSHDRPHLSVCLCFLVLPSRCSRLEKETNEKTSTLPPQSWQRQQRLGKFHWGGRAGVCEFFGCFRQPGIRQNGHTHTHAQPPVVFIGY